MFYKVGFATVGALLVAASPAAAVTLTTMSGSAVAGAQIDSASDLQGSTVTDAWTSGPRDLVADYSALLTGPNGGTTSASAHAAASWVASGLSGSVSLSNGWDFETLDGENQVVAGFTQPSWTYVFTPDADATFSLDYAVSAVGVGFGLQGYYITVDGAQTRLSGPGYILNPASSGTFTALLAGGTSHSIALATGGNLSVSPGTSLAGTEVGSFSFGITGAGAVPEPASWAMMLGGFALIGGAMRSRRAGGLSLA